MSFETIETSRQLGQPVNLFLFRYGVAAGAYHAFTDAERPLTHDSITYEPEAIGRGDVTSSGSLDRTTLEISVPLTNPLGELFLVYPPSQVVTVIIFQGHIGDPANEFLAIWNGRVINCSRGDSEITLTCEPVATSMRRSGLRRNWQYSCPHVLYGAQCQADKVAATISRPAVGAAGNLLTLSAGWDSVQPAAKYIGGMVSWSHEGNPESRTILRVSGDGTVLTCSGFLRGIAAGDAVDLVLGCNHSGALDGDCITLHDNIHRFGGYLWIPLKNPIGSQSPFV